MELLENINTVVSICAGGLSVFMFFLAKKEKNNCVKIKTQIEQNIEFTKKSALKSKDNIDIGNVHTFDNRKTIN